MHQHSRQGDKVAGPTARSLSWTKTLDVQTEPVRCATGINSYSKSHRDIGRNTNTPLKGTPGALGQQTLARDSHRHLRSNVRSFSTWSDRPAQHLQRAYIALGSNMGDRLNMIEQACKQLDATKEIILKRTSNLFQTEAMYVNDQDDFINGVCEIETSLEPLELLDTLQSIENDLGRKRLVNKGPRTLDLDILLYDDQAIENDRLIVPHKLMLERPFVLQPLCNLIPHSKPPAGSSSRETYHEHLQTLPPTKLPSSTFTPLSNSIPSLSLQALLPTRKTHIMSIINLTPDSFSDGGHHDPTSPTYLHNLLTSHLTAGATILDIGGQSTRPQAPPITSADETSRVIPAIRTARTLIDDPANTFSAAISIDTYRADVARAAVEAGADIINDVSAGLLDPDMLSTMAELGCTVCLMHMRGTPETMGNRENTTYPDGVVETVGRELLQRVCAAEKAGVRRWRMILDPGIGFAKTQAGNLELLRRWGELRGYEGLEGLPWLVGASRKGFVGNITGVREARERAWGTAAAVAASVQGGADVVRVHDVLEMGQVAKMADAIWRV